MASPEPAKWVTSGEGLAEETSWLQGWGRDGLTTAMINEQLRRAEDAGQGVLKGKRVFVVGAIGGRRQ